MPLHADIAVMCRRIGFDNLNPIIWHKIANANYEVENGSKFLGKPYEPNAIIKNDIEFILMQRKPGGYRQPTEEQRRLSKLSKRGIRGLVPPVLEHDRRFDPSSTPRPSRSSLLIVSSACSHSMATPCSTPSAAPARRCSPHSTTGRNSIGIDIDPEYCRMALRRLERETRSLFGQATVTLEEPAAHARPASETAQPVTVSDAPRRRRKGKRE